MSYLWLSEEGDDEGYAPPSLPCPVCGHDGPSTAFVIVIMSCVAFVAGLLAGCVVSLLSHF